MQRRKFLKYGTGLSASLALSSNQVSSQTNLKPTTFTALDPNQIKTIEQYNQVYIPPLISNSYSRRYKLPTLFVQDTLHEFTPGVLSPAVGLSTSFQHCSYLGPTIKVKKGDLVDFSIINLRSEAITNHWHGMHIPGRIDGGPHQMIEPGAEWNITMPIIQEASTNWYHAHTCNKTAEQVYFGHAGMFIVDDFPSWMLGLPNAYGINEFPLVVQDKLFNQHGEQVYDLRGSPIFIGDDMIVNGTINPFLSISAGLTRFKILNASNDRHYEFYFKDGRHFNIISSDGGLLNNPVQVNEITLYSGERADIIIDFSKDKGAIIDMVAKTIVFDQAGGDLIVPIIRLAVNWLPALPAFLPTKLRSRRKFIDWQKEVASTPSVTRTFDLGNSPDMSEMQINNKAYDMSIINETVKQDQKEVWQIQSLTGGHPFHIHGCSFLIMEIDGQPPKEEFKGWKDIVVLPLPEPGTPPGSKVYTCKILVEFNLDTYRTATEFLGGRENASDLQNHIPYMYHCHLLAHEDKGMMGQFSVYTDE